MIGMNVFVLNYTWFLGLCCVCVVYAVGKCAVKCVDVHVSRRPSSVHPSLQPDQRSEARPRVISSRLV